MQWLGAVIVGLQRPMKLCLSCSAQNDDRQTYCGHCGGTLPEHPNDSVLLEQAFDYQPLIKLNRWALWLQGAGAALAVLIWLYAVATKSDVSVPAVIALALWGLAAITLGIGILVSQWQNATMLAESHPEVCKALKSLFWWEIVLHVLTGQTERAGSGLPFTIAVSLISMALNVWLQSKRDKVIVGRFPSKVTIAQWHSWGAGTVVAIVALVVVGQVTK